MCWVCGILRRIMPSLEKMYPLRRVRNRGFSGGFLGWLENAAATAVFFVVSLWWSAW
jgi:hypothetical protein